jgi:NAD-dependent deacetylase
LERSGHLTTVFTQNVDNLHQEAGSRNVVEYHGNSREVICMSCGSVTALNAEIEAMETPFCVCGGIYKPNVVLFGEMIPPRAMFKAEAYAQIADVVIVVGTSAQVFPAAQLPLTAKEHGATIIEVNIERTGFTDTITDYFLQGRAGDVLPRLATETITAGALA